MGTMTAIVPSAISPTLAERLVPVCPACGNNTSHRVDEWATSFETISGGLAYRQPAYLIKQCPECGLHYKSHTLSETRLQEYYASMEFTPYEYGYECPTERIVRDILSRISRGGKVLDYGCSSGRLLKDWADKLDCYGLELNEQSASVARDRGIKIISEEEFRSVGSNHFDAIVLADVYEHLLRPTDLMTALVKALKSDGMLIVVTGNVDAIPRRHRVAEFWYFRGVGHLHMAGERHLKWIGSLLNLRLRKLHKCSHYDFPLRERFMQLLRSFVYYRFRASPHGLLAAALRLIPRANRAELWSNAPALNCTADHFVAVFQKVV